MQAAGATQASGYLQSKVDAARQETIRQALAKIRDQDICCASKPAPLDAGSAAGLLDAKMKQHIYRGPNYNTSSSAYLKRKIDAMEYSLLETDRFADVEQRRPAPPCPPAEVVYHAGEPIPVPKFRCALTNNMLHA